jgi:assimilatory nitrate reductase catalytic subunit
MMWHDFAYGMLTADAKLAEHLNQRTYRAAAIIDGDVDGFICIGPAGEPLNLELSELDVHDDGGISLAQISAMSMVETEPVVCACFGIGESCIRDAMASGQANTVTEIGQATRAGTNCGSCLPELKRMIAQERNQERNQASTRAKEAAE